MGILDAIKRQLRTVIEWENPNSDELFSLWSENGDEIKNASKLLLKPGQGVIFIYEGKVQAIHLKEGMYELSTANIPFLTTLSKFMQAFESEHKVQIVFFWQTEFLNQKWGTSSPIKYTDPVYKFPVGLRSFGNFSFKLTKPDLFFVNVVGSRGGYLVEEAKRTIQDRFVQPLTDALAEASYSFIDIDRHREELAAKLTEKARPEFDKLGFELTDLRIEGTDFDEDTRARVNRIANVQAEAQAAQAAGINYLQLQQTEALREAARNPGGAAGAGVGIGAGIGLGQAMAAGFTTPGGAPSAAKGSVEDRLKRLEDLKSKSLISEADYEAKKREILSDL